VGPERENELMTKTTLPMAMVLLVFCGFAQADTHVRGYYKSNGTYVAPYERTDANGTTSDNYSHRGNINPYTGKPGDKNN